MAGARSGVVRWISSVRALWKWLDFDELLFGFFCGSALGFLAADFFFTIHG